MNIFQLLLLAFIAVPIAEIYVLLEVSDVVGVGYTVFAVVATAVIGAALMRAQGIATAMRMREELANGQAPAQTIVEGVILLFAGALLLTPGFITDTVGFLCLTPPVRAAVARKVVAGAMVNVMTPGGPGAAGPFHRPRGNGSVIDGEFTHENDDPPTGPRRLDS